MKAIHYLILLSIGMIGTYLIFCEPAEDSARWLTTFLLSKAAGVLTMAAFFRLHKRWSRPSAGKRTG